MSRVYVCISFNEATQQCDAGAWIESWQGPFPPLSLEDAGVLGASIVTFWVICAVLRIVREQLSNL